MVDEQFPLQRKILKGQVDVRNEETSERRGRENCICVLFRLALLFTFVTWYISLSITSQGQTNGCTVGGKNVQINLRASLFLMYFYAKVAKRRAASNPSQVNTLHTEHKHLNNHAPSMQK